MAQAAQALLLLTGEVAMKQHYNLNDVEWNKLAEAGITTLDLLRAVPEFAIRPGVEEHGGCSCIGIMYFLDRHGDFTDQEKKDVKFKIARGVFASMDGADKMAIIRYLDWMENGDEEETGEE